MSNPTLEFPRAFAFAIDDLGWNEGSNLAINGRQGPYRAGVKRVFDLSDYRAIVDVGKAVGARIQCLFILSEMDRENILAQYPTATYMRDKWDNSWRVSEKQVTIMNYVKAEAAYMEFGLHGLGHEYWADDGKQRRAEWYNLTDRQPWPEDDLRRHIQAFREIMAQYGLTPENGHTFPESFVPCAYSYYWNPEGDYSLGKILAEAGVKYANTDFAQIPYQSPPEGVNAGGFDHGVHVINRMNYGNHWYELASLPKVPFHYQYTDIIESHWPNWLAQDDFLQPGVTEQWIRYYRDVQRLPNRYIAKNTEQLHSQWLYNRYTQVKVIAPCTVEIDNTQMPDEAYQNDLLGNMVLKVKLNTGEHIASATLGQELLPAYFEDEGYGFLYLPRLEKKRYTLKYSIGNIPPPLCVYNDGTYNVYSLTPSASEITLDLKVYGSQDVKVLCDNPKRIESDSAALQIEQSKYDPNSRMLRIFVTARDMQGSRGRLRVFL